MDFWHDNWIGSGPLCHRVEIFQDQQVVDFVSRGDWDIRSLSQALQPELVRLVMASRPPTCQGEDRMEERLNHLFCIGETARQGGDARGKDSWGSGGGPNLVADKGVVVGSVPIASMATQILGELARQKTLTILPVRWMSPGVGYKLNTDGCALGNRGRNGGGGVVRDSREGFLLGFAWFLGVTTSLHAKLKALVYGVNQCVARGYLDLHLEVDSLSLVRIISGDHACPWRLQVELDELMQHQGLFRSVKHCYRKANKPSDRLAKLGATEGTDSVFDSFEALPPLVRGDI
ncbi:uncharacterized protein LOC113782393 [Coffea eugenioides]|uniref:uncharacterized protein LOC113782393 n=1 Tax=Coffea eugenioides TaxID=49369 RepID=UPI000F60CE18|nr:uncharacterized protein LOC113782393 [Coffea eugenioides]